MRRPKEGERRQMGHCLAKTHSGSPCQRPAGWGTEHPGTGRCKLHGGCGTDPDDQRGDSSALKTGEYGTVLVETLSPDERRLYEAADTDPASLLDQALRLSAVRELRMMRRIAQVEAAADEQGMVTLRTEDGTGPEGEAHHRTTKTNAVALAVDIEDSLTRVQAVKSRLIAMRRQLDKETGGSYAPVLIMDYVRFPPPEEPGSRAESGSVGSGEPNR